MGQACRLVLYVGYCPLEAGDQAGDSVAKAAIGSRAITVSYEKRRNSRGRGKIVVDIALKFSRK